MTTLQKLGFVVVLTGLVTAATLPGRQTVPVINAGRRLFTGAESTAISGRAS